MNWLPVTKSAIATISKYGFDMTLTRKSNGSYNPTTGIVGTPSTSAYTVTGLKLGTLPDESLLAGGLVRSGDNLVLIAPGVVAPLPTDTLTIGGTIYTVIAVYGLDPGGVDLLYNCWVRK